MSKKLNATAIQKHLDIKEIKDDVVILKSGALRSVLMTSSINFALKSEEERKAIVYKFQDFLNSLDFSIQVLISSRKFNIKPYVEMLEQRQNEQNNELLKMQTEEYINFVKSLTDMSNIMTESFYLVIPYNTAEIRANKLLDKIPFPLPGQKEKNKNDSQDFEEQKNNLWQRVEFVTATLRATGVKSTPLKTDELIELFYKLYNPGAKKDQELEKAKEMRLK
jgi:hypothetical protein